MPCPGETFDRYKIESVLGEGGMGTVYRAFDPRLNRRVALKVVRLEKGEKGKPGSEGTTDATARLLREARASAALDHPNAVGIFDVGEVDGVAFIAMELVAGRTLRAFIGDASVPATVRLRWLFEVARVLAAAHETGLVHRDIKPENVMIRTDGGVKVLDFGIARRLQSQVDPTAETEFEALMTITQKGSTVGTPLYMAPEQIRGDAVDERADQFAWGVIAFELLAGRLPWSTGKGTLGAVASILTEEPEPLRDTPALQEMPPVVAETVHRALRKKPSERFPTMSALVHALEPCVAVTTSKPPATMTTTESVPPFLETPGPLSGRVGARNPTPITARDPATTPTSPPQRRNWARAGLGMGIAALVIGGASVAARRYEPPPPAPPAAPSAPQSQRALPLNPEAASSYRAALQARHDGSETVAETSYRKVIALDPAFAPALLRLGMILYGTGEAVPEARELFQRAALLRSTLTEEDQLLLDAYAPCVQQQRMKHDECGRRLEAASARFPSADLLADLAGAQLFEGRLEDGIATCSKALALDPSYARVAALMGQMQAYAGRLDQGLATLVECTKRLPSATSCIDYRIWMHTAKGDCTAVEEDARDWMAAAPLDGGRWGPQHYLADAQISLGRPREAIRETLHQKWAKTGNGARDADEALDLASLAILAGDFATAEHQISELERIGANDPTLDAHALPAVLRVGLFEEEGRVAEAAQVAEAFMNRKESFIADTRDDDWTIAKDPAMRMNDILYRGGKLTRDGYVARRTSWLGQWDNAPLRGYEYFPAYVYWVHTREEATEAIEAIPKGGIAAFRPFIYPEAAIGHAYTLLDRVDEAMPYLEQATRACYALEAPFTFVRARFFLAEALEKKGDHAGACAAYGEVVTRWGGAKSVTAAEAKRRIGAMRCGK